MALKVETRSGGERMVVVGMMTSRSVLGPIVARWEPGLFASRYASLIAGWCVDHYKRYHRAPGRDIVGYFDEWAATSKDRDTIEAVESLLASFSEEYEKLKKTVSPDYVVDRAAKIFNINKLADLKNTIEADLENGDGDKAEERVTKFRRVELGLGSGIEVLTDEEAMTSAFEARDGDLIEYPDALGNFFRGSLGRDCFVSGMGKEKIGKSFWLLDMCYRAVEQGRRVAYFETGDMSQPQVLRRLAARAANRPLDACRYEWPEYLESPGNDPMPNLRCEWRQTDYPLSAQEASKALRDLGGDDPDRLKLSCHPNSSINVGGIDTILEGWERDGWAADVVIVDYADILAAPDGTGRSDTRDQINATWKALRAMSQRRHCLVATVTQTDADSYTARLLSRENFSEDKRKFSHVTGMFGINQLPSEKEKGLYRLNWIALRELEFSEKKVVWTAGCLGVSNPAVLSTF